MLTKMFFKNYPFKNNTPLVVLTLLITLSLAVLAFSPVGRKALSAYREDAVLFELIKSSGAEFKSVDVTGWVRVDVDAAGAGNPEALANIVAARLNLLETGRKVESWQNKFARGAKVEGKMSDGRVFSVLGQTLDLPEGMKVSHVMASTAGVENRKARFYKQKIYKALSGCGGDSHVALTYSGKIKNELNGEELLAKAEKMMTLAGTPVQEKTVKDNLVSLTGFSRRFSSDVSYAGREVNLNVALRSNPVEQVTYVYVASPVIFTEY